jgi:PTH1 family peptidyl-tRNA hydrolase
LIIQNLADQHSIPITRKKFLSFYGPGEIEGRRVLLVLPQTYMNLSGEAIGPLVRYNQTPLDHLLVVHDDLDLPWGRIRIVAQGGAAGHKGILSVIEHLKSNAFLRLRAGIGRPPEGRTTEDFVLEPLPKGIRPSPAQVIDQGRSAIEHLLREGVEKTMSVYNARRPEET